MRVRVPDTEVTPSRAVGHRLAEPPPSLRHMILPSSSQAALLGSLPVARLPGTLPQRPMAGGSKPRSWLLSRPDTTSVAGVGKGEDCPRGATKPATCPNWVPTWARTIGGARGPAPCRDHALHPLGFSWVIKAEEGGLTQAQHAACRESTRSEGQGRAEAAFSPQHLQAHPGSEEPSPPALPAATWSTPDSAHA